MQKTNTSAKHGRSALGSRAPLKPCGVRTRSKVGGFPRNAILAIVRGADRRGLFLL